MKIKLYYSIPDYFPSFRMDVSELFGISLQNKGVSTEWFMGNDDPKLNLERQVFFGQDCYTHPKVPGNNIVSKVATKIAYWLTDAVFMLRSACCGRFDILQTRDKYIISFIALVLAKITNKRFIYWCSYPFPEHTLALANERSGFAKTLLMINGKLAYFLLYKIVMRFSDHNFVQSQQMLQDIAGYGVPVERMTPVPMGVPSRLLDWAATHPVHVISDRIVYVGTMASVRHLATLIDAFALVYRHRPSATLLMVGDGNKPYERAALEQQVSDLGISSAVEFTGFVPIETAWSLTASAAVCISPFYPSQILRSASPTKLYEYMALGKPVVCNDHPEQSEIIKDSGSGLCVPWGAEPFAEAMIWLLEHPDDAQTMAARGPAWVAQNRVYDRIAETVWNKYQDILKVNA